MLIHNVTQKELLEFIAGLTEIETKYYDIRKENLKTFVLINGFKDGGKLVGVGGIGIYYCLIPHTYYMIKREYQGQGFGSILSQKNMEYARRKYPFLISTIEAGNTRARKIAEHRGFMLAISRDTHSYYYKPFNWFGKLLGFVFPCMVAVYYRLKKRG